MRKHCLCCGVILDSFNILDLCSNCISEIQRINELEDDKRKECEIEFFQEFEDDLELRLIDKDDSDLQVQDTESKPLNLVGEEYEKLVHEILPIEDLIEDAEKVEDFELETGVEKAPSVNNDDDWCSSWH